MSLLGKIVPVALLASTAIADPTSEEKGTCEFENDPIFPGYYWDPNCEEGMNGCLADGKNLQCRFCGGGEYETPCPPSSCHFPGGQPFVPYYWDNDCEMGKLGCWADGIHAQCRFCGDHPYTDLPCPEGRTSIPNGAACNFDAPEPTTPHYWDAACTLGMFGCNADGKNVQCRWCGEGEYADIECPASKVCTFANEPTVPYFWEPACKMGMLGCNADGVHVECRFCAVRPFQDISCPEHIAPPADECHFPMHAAPQIAYYWDPDCAEGTLGCWADGIHAECRFCGGNGDFKNVTCPRSDGADSGSEAPVTPSPVDPSLPKRREGADATAAPEAPKTASAQSASQRMDTLRNAAKDMHTQDGRENDLSGSVGTGRLTAVFVAIAAAVQGA